MNTEIVKVNNTDIECPYENEQHYVAVRSICKALGIDHQKQFERIKNDPILKDAYTDTVYTSDSSGTRKQAMFCLPVRYIFGWIFTIDESKVSDRARPTFMQYKRECYDALYEHFFLRAAMYEQRERMLAKKRDEILELEQKKQDASEQIKRVKSEIQVIETTPIMQLKLDFPI